MSGDALLNVFIGVFALVGFFVAFEILVNIINDAGLREIFNDCLMFVLASLWLLPMGYFAVGAYYWLLNGRWMSINLCYDAESNFFCPTGKLGLDKILQVMADSPFLLVLGVTAAAYTVLIFLLKDAES